MNFRIALYSVKLFIVALILLTPHPTQAANKPLNGVVASVNGKAITLRDIQLKAKLGHLPSKTEVAGDTRLKRILEDLILENILEDEAKEKQISVAETEVDDYIKDIAAQNNMSLAEFRTALMSENISFMDYKTRVRKEILKTKIVGSLYREGTAVSEDEIKNYLNDHPEINKKGEKVKLRQIVINKKEKTPEKLEKLLKKLEEEIEDGDDFEDLVEDFSDEKKDGGLIGILAVTDLSVQVKDAISKLDVNSISPRVETSDNIKYFFVEERLSGDSDTTVRDGVRKMLENQKMKEKLQQYFTFDIYKKHSIEKKI
jgi:peptidyl-prolyl cis-trans isomerase SurA